MSERSHTSSDLVGLHASVAATLVAGIVLSLVTLVFLLSSDAWTAPTATSGYGIDMEIEAVVDTSSGA